MTDNYYRFSIELFSDDKETHGAKTHTDIYADSLEEAIERFYKRLQQDTIRKSISLRVVK